MRLAGQLCPSGTSRDEVESVVRSSLHLPTFHLQPSNQQPPLSPRTATPQSLLDVGPLILSSSCRQHAALSFIGRPGGVAVEPSSRLSLQAPREHDSFRPRHHGCATTTRPREALTSKYRRRQPLCQPCLARPEFITGGNHVQARADLVQPAQQGHHRRRIHHPQPSAAARPGHVAQEQRRAHKDLVRTRKGASVQGAASDHRRAHHGPGVRVGNRLLLLVCRAHSFRQAASQLPDL